MCYAILRKVVRNMSGEEVPQNLSLILSIFLDLEIIGLSTYNFLSEGLGNKNKKIFNGTLRKLNNFCS